MYIEYLRLLSLTRQLCEIVTNAVSSLQEFLSGIPGGVFGELTEEFYQISLESSLELTIVYLHR